VNVAGDLPVQKFRLFDGQPVKHGVTTRTDLIPADGDVSYVTGPDPLTVRRNRDRWARAISVESRRLVCAQQVHGINVRLVAPEDAGRGYASFDDAIAGTDALITQTPELPLAVFCADCVPILLIDPVRRAVGAIHAGWRGTVADIAGQTIRAMSDCFGTSPADILAGIGPSIGRCCYPVGPEVIDAWKSAGFDRRERAVERDQRHLRFDLWKANTLALIAAGVPASQIEVQGDCTRCQSDRYFSYRAQGKQAGRFAAIIALTSPDGAPDGGH
jgi:YfiH family protein